MNTQIQNILAENGTKTSKIEKLILLGLTRKEIATLVTNGNYGFVQNVYAKMREQGRLNRAAEINFMPTVFNRKFGVEFESYGVNKEILKRKLNEAGITCIVEGYNHTTRTHWKIVTDSSINGNNSFELVSPILEGINGLNEVKTVCRVLKACNAKINKTCGTHVHFDAINFELSHWKNIYKNYAKLEDTIDSMMPESRRKNNNTYCKSLKTIYNFENRINNSNDLTQIENVFNNSRYFKINPTSYNRHKTIEFRQHAGTIEFEKISNWILFLHNLVEFSKQNATGSDFESMKKFNQPEVLTYIQNRITKFAA